MNNAVPLGLDSRRTSELSINRHAWIFAMMAFRRRARSDWLFTVGMSFTLTGWKSI